MKTRIADIVAKISPRLFFAIAYYHNRRKILKLKDPRDLSALWIKRVLSGQIDDIYYLADKYQVRQYVVEKDLGSILPTLLGVYDTPAQIQYDTLPSRFAIKLNYGAGMNVICQDKEKLDTVATNIKLEEWMNKSEYNLAERHYNKITRRIIIEEYIEDGSGGFPIDYKFLCLNGKAVCCLVCRGREEGHAAYLPYSIMDWKPIYDWVRGKVNENIKLVARPSNLSEMVNIAEKLSEGLDMVRVDLYSNGIQIWFGEMTLTPAGCIFHRWSNKAMNELGNIYLHK